MMKDTGHFDQIKRLRIPDKELVPFTAAYDVRNFMKSLRSFGIHPLISYFRLHFHN